MKKKPKKYKRRGSISRISIYILNSFAQILIHFLSRLYDMNSSKNLLRSSKIPSKFQLILSQWFYSAYFTNYQISGRGESMFCSHSWLFLKSCYFSKIFKKGVFIYLLGKFKNFCLKHKLFIFHQRNILVNSFYRNF